MGLNTSAAYLGNTNNSVNTDRKILEVLSGGVDGVVATGDFTVSPVSGQHQVSVSAGRVFAKGRDVTGSQGSYFAWSDGADTVTLPVPQSNPFFATLLIRIADSQYGTIPGTHGAYFQVLSGTAAASPVALTDVEIDATDVPGTWYRLADIRINTGDTGAIPSGQITDRRAYVGTVASLAADNITQNATITALQNSLAALQVQVAALVIPDIRVQQSQPSSGLVAGKTVWIDY